MIICTRDEADSLINQDSNLFKNDERNKNILDYETILIKRGKSKGDDYLDEEKRKEIATLALTSGMTNEEVAEFCRVHPQTVSSFKNGEVANGTETNEELKEHVIEVKGEIQSAAKNKLLLAIEAITDEKIHSAKVRDIAGIARDMSSVIKNMSDNGGLTVQNNKVVIYQPRIRDDDDFDVITVSE